MSQGKVQTIDRALDIIELLAIEKVSLGVSEIGQRLGLHKSTVHRILNALAERGYIEKELKYGNYKLGLKFLEISSLYLNHLELKTEAVPYLRRLASITAQAVHLAILEGIEVIYIEKVEPTNSIRMYSQIGRRIPAYCSAIGKVLLSDLEDKKIMDVLDNTDIEKFTPNTIIDLEEIHKEIEKVRKYGWAVDNEEYEAGIRCIAAPVYDYTGKVIAAVSTSGDIKVISPERDDDTAQYVIETAGLISGRMGFIQK